MERRIEADLKLGRQTSQIEGARNTLSVADFHLKSHFFGRLTMWIVILTVVTFPLFLSYVLGLHPGWGAIGTAFFTYASVIAFAWVLEPVMYYPTLGISGSYVSFLTGNISNMCLPAAATAQNAIGAKVGTRKGEVVATLAISTASLVNIFLLILIILFGSYVLTVLPSSVLELTAYVLPAIFGGMIGQFAIQKPLYGIAAVAIGLLVNLLPLPSIMNGFTCVVLTAGVCVMIEKSKQGKGD